MPELREYRIEERYDRLVGLAHFASKVGLTDLAAQLERAAQEGCDADREVALIEGFGRALVGQQILEGLAWDAWMKTRSAMRDELDRVSPDAPIASIRSTGEVDVLMRNIVSCLTTHERSSDPTLRLHAVMSALAQVEALLTDHVRDQLFAHVKADCPKADERLREYLSLGWAPAVAHSLSQVRNAWAHGRALLVPDGLVLHDRKTFSQVARVSLAELEQLVRAGQAAWTAMQFDLVYQAACEIRESRRLNMVPVEAKERDRRLAEAVRDELQNQHRDVEK